MFQGICTTTTTTTTTTITTVSTSTHQPLHGASAAVLNDKIYITGGYFIDNEGGWNCSSDTYTLEDHPSPLHPSNATFVRQPEGMQLKEERYYHGSIAYLNKIWVAGGRDDFLSSVEVLDIKTKTSALQAQSMVRTRWTFSLVVVLGVLYAVGGDTTYGLSIERMTNDETHSWEMVTEKEPDGAYRFDCACVAVGSKIFVIGGSNAAGSVHNRTWDAFDVLTHQWVSGDLLPSPLQRRLPRRTFVHGRAVVLPALLAASKL